MKHTYLCSLCLFLCTLILVSSCGSAQGNHSNTQTDEQEPLTSITEILSPEEQATLRNDTYSRLNTNDAETPGHPLSLNCPSDGAALASLRNDPDPGRYVARSELKKIKVGQTPAEVADALSKPQFTYYIKPQICVYLPENYSGGLPVTLYPEIETLFLMENGELLKIVFSQSYENTDNMMITDMDDIVPSGLTVCSITVCTIDRYLQEYGQTSHFKAAKTENVVS